jgi:hypothetical protein
VKQGRRDVRQTHGLNLTSTIVSNHLKKASHTILLEQMSNDWARRLKVGVIHEAGLEENTLGFNSEDRQNLRTCLSKTTKLTLTAEYTDMVAMTQRTGGSKVTKEILDWISTLLHTKIDECTSLRLMLLEPHKMPEPLMVGFLPYPSETAEQLNERVKTSHDLEGWGIYDRNGRRRTRQPLTGYHVAAQELSWPGQTAYVILETGLWATV